MPPVPHTSSHVEPSASTHPLVPRCPLAPTATEDEKLGELLFAHTANYPDEPPCLRFRAVRGLSDADVAAGTAHLNEIIQENLGMAMVFTLVQAAKEWLRSEWG